MSNVQGSSSIGKKVTEEVIWRMIAWISEVISFIDFSGTGLHSKNDRVSPEFLISFLLTFPRPVFLPLFRKSSVLRLVWFSFQWWPTLAVGLQRYWANLFWRIEHVNSWTDEMSQTFQLLDTCLRTFDKNFLTVSSFEIIIVRPYLETVPKSSGGYMALWYNILWIP